MGILPGQKYFAITVAFADAEVAVINIPTNSNYNPQDYDYMFTLISRSFYSLVNVAKY